MLQIWKSSRTSGWRDKCNKFTLTLTPPPRDSRKNIFGNAVKRVEIRQIYPLKRASLGLFRFPWLIRVGLDISGERERERDLAHASDFTIKRARSSDPGVFECGRGGLPFAMQTITQRIARKRAHRHTEVPANGTGYRRERERGKDTERIERESFAEIPRRRSPLSRYVSAESYSPKRVQDKVLHYYATATERGYEWSCRNWNFLRRTLSGNK